MLLGCGSAFASPGQQSLPQVRTLVVMPFANRSNAPGLDWVSKASAEVYLLLARTKLRENSSEDAAGLLDRALQLDPGNAEALALKRKLDGRASISPQSAAKP